MFVMFDVSYVPTVFPLKVQKRAHLRGSIANVGLQVKENDGGEHCWQLLNPTNLQFTTHKPHINCSWKREDYQRNQSPSSPSSSLDETKLMRLTHCHLSQICSWA